METLTFHDLQKVYVGGNAVQIGQDRFRVCIDRTGTVPFRFRDASLNVPFSVGEEFCVNCGARVCRVGVFFPIFTVDNPCLDFCLGVVNYPFAFVSVGEEYNVTVLASGSVNECRIFRVQQAI